jgi:hypothetical protein
VLFVFILPLGASRQTKLVSNDGVEVYVGLPFNRTQTMLFGHDRNWKSGQKCLIEKKGIYGGREKGKFWVGKLGKVNKIRVEYQTKLDSFGGVLGIERVWREVLG